MNKKEKLIEIIQNAVGGCARNWADVIATALIESKEVIVPPCKVGDTVYYLDNSFKEICKAQVIKIEINYYTKPQLWLTIEYFSNATGTHEYKTRIDLMLNKTVFLTKEEAEQALKKDADKTHEQLSNPKIMNAIIKTMIKW